MKKNLLQLIRIKAWIMLIGILVLIAGAMYEKRQEGAPSNTQGLVQIGGAFKLTTHTGATLVDTQMVGKPYLVFFGYTHCPDICPAALYDMTLLLQSLGEDGKDLKVLFVTVDPERDTPEVMKNYLQNFHPNIIGLTGSIAEVDQMVRSYRAYAKKAPPSSSGDYAMDHSTGIYMMGRLGTFITMIDPQAPTEKKAAVVRKYM